MSQFDRDMIDDERDAWLRRRKRWISALFDPAQMWLTEFTDDTDDE